MEDRAIKLTISRIRKPLRDDLNQEIQIFSDSLGLFTIRDKEKSCFRVFIELLKSAKKNKPLSSDELAFKTSLSRGTVVHHLNRLIASGIVVHRQNKYILRENSLAELTEELQNDLDNIFKELKMLAKHIEEKLE